MTSMMDPVILARESLKLRKAAPYHLQVELDRHALRQSIALPEKSSKPQKLSSVRGVNNTRQAAHNKSDKAHPACGVVKPSSLLK